MTFFRFGKLVLRPTERLYPLTWPLDHYRALLATFPIPRIKIGPKQPHGQNPSCFAQNFQKGSHKTTFPALPEPVLDRNMGRKWQSGRTKIHPENFVHRVPKMEKTRHNLPQTGILGKIRTVLPKPHQIGPLKRNFENQKTYFAVKNWVGASPKPASWNKFRVAWGKIYAKRTARVVFWHCLNQLWGLKLA